VVTNYTGTGIRFPMGIAAGPDGALWFTNEGSNSIGRITTSGVVTNYTGTGIDEPMGITAGPDGALWFTNYGDHSIGRITTSGVVTNYTASGVSTPNGITAGPDGALWFTNGSVSVGQITTSGAITIYRDNGVERPIGITAGPDGALWFTCSLNANSIGRITTSVTPAISAFTPASGAAGTTVTITGQNLSGATAVAFDGTTAVIVSDSATQIVTQVPSGAATGPIRVTTAAGTATSATSFTVP
jgi:streptogramin lyase